MNRIKDAFRFPDLLRIMLLTIPIVVESRAGIGTQSESQAMDPIQAAKASDMKVDAGLRGLSTASSISDEELDHCLVHLEEVAIDGKVGEKEFLFFLENVSSSPLDFDDFYELPLQLVLVFYTAACTGGRNCSTEKAKISLENFGVSQGFLKAFCASVKDTTVVQIIYKFQYLILLQAPNAGRGSTDSSGSSDVDELVRKLEHATQEVLMDDLGCSGRKAFDSSARLLRSKTPDCKRKRSSTDKSAEASGSHRRWPYGRKLDMLGNRICGFSVQAGVDHWVGMQCLSGLVTQLHEDDSMKNQTSKECLLVSSEVKVTATSLLENLNEEELHSIVATAIKEAMLGDEFNKYLAVEGKTIASRL